MTHTPTPWTREGSTIYVLNSAGTNRMCFNASGGGGFADDGSRYSNAEAEANAEFIVRAANSFETLVSALRRLAQNMRDLNHYHTHNSVTGADVWADLECETHLAAADAALKQAEGN